MFYYPLLLLLLVADNICTGFQPESRLPWVGPKLRLALRQAKRSQESMPTKLHNLGKSWKPTVRSDEADNLNEILVNPNELERVGEEADHLVEMIRTLEQAIQAKQMVEPKLKRPKMDGRIRILKVCILVHIYYFK